MVVSYLVVVVGLQIKNTVCSIGTCLIAAKAPEGRQDEWNVRGWPVGWVRGRLSLKITEVLRGHFLRR